MASLIIPLMTFALYLMTSEPMAESEFYDTYTEDTKRLAGVEWIDNELGIRMRDSDQFIKMVSASAHEGRFLVTLLYEENNQWFIWRGTAHQGFEVQLECDLVHQVNALEEILNSLPNQDFNEISNIGNILHGEVFYLSFQVRQLSVERRYYFNQIREGGPIDISFIISNTDALLDNCMSEIQGY